LPNDIPGSHHDVVTQERSGEFLHDWVYDLHNRTILFRVGNLIFTTYAFLAGLAFATGFAVSLWYSTMLGIDAGTIAPYYLFVIVPSVLIGLRGFSVMLEWRELFRRPLQTIVKPGYMLHGGVLGGVVGMAIVAELTGIPFLRLVDGPAFAMPIGEAIARLGCYVYGCCWGRPTESRFGVRYTSPHSKVVRCAPHLHGVRIHPAQLYALVVYLAMYGLFFLWLPYAPFDGAIAGAFLIAHSVARYGLETFRQDDRGRLWGPITHTHVYSALMVLGGLACLFFGVNGTSALHLDRSVRFVSVILDPTILPWIVAYGMVFGGAYGVHYRKVGSWLGIGAR